MLKNLISFIQYLHRHFWRKLISYRLWKEYTKDLVVKKLPSSTKKEIRNYWKGLTGKRVSTKWHDLFYTLTGKVNIKYCPFEIYDELKGILSPDSIAKVVDDKNTYRHLFHGFNIPKRVVECCNGIYYLPEMVGGGNEVSFNEVIRVLRNVNGCVIKPSKDSSAGIGVKALDVINGITKDNKPVEEVLRFYNNNYVIERKIKNREDLASFNPTSCNTFRICTFRNSEGFPTYLSSYLRIGRIGNIIDNASSGGIAVAVNSDGTLWEKGCSLRPYQVKTETDNGTKFKDFVIKDFDKVISTALNAHSRLPIFGLIGWDITIDEGNNIIIIEYNPPCDMRKEQLIFQTSGFLDYQEEIMKIAFKK